MKNVYILICICLCLVTGVRAQSINNFSTIGPLNLPGNVSGQINGIGRISQLKFHPTNGAKLYAISAKGGLWTSNDTANTWVKTGSDNLPFTMCASVCIDYSNDQTLYLGTGDADYYSPGYGVWKSTDGGATWKAANAGMGYRLVDEIIMSPTNPNVLLAATELGVYKSTDAGASWTLKKQGGQFTDMILKPNARTRTVYAATQNGFFVSRDMGDTWTEVILSSAGINKGGRIGVTKADTNLVYLTYVGDPDFKTPVLKSTNSATSFTVVKPANTLNLNSYELSGLSNKGQENYNYDLGVDPVDPSRLYIVGHVFWTSTNGGASWTNYFGWYEQVHTDMHQIEVSPHDYNKLFNINDGGVWVSKNKGVSGSFVQKNNGLATTECYHSAQSPSTKNLYYTGTQDNGGIYYDGTSWITNKGGDEGSPMTVDYTNTARVFYPANTDEFNTYNGTVYQYGVELKKMNLPFVTNGDVKIIFSPVSTTVGFVNYNDGVYRCPFINANPMSWTKMSLTENVKEIALSPTSANVLYVLTADNKMFRSDNALGTTPTFTALTLPADAQTNMTASIAVVKSNTDIVYIACGQKVYRSADKGVTWTSVSGGLLPVNIINILNDPFSTNESMYLATALGVYYKNNTMTNWLNYSKGLPTISNITDLSIYSDGTSNSVIRVAFFGRGVWQSPLYTPTNVTVSITSHPPVAYVAEGNITFTSTATSSSGTVNKVEYYNGATLIGSATSSPWSVTWSNVTEGTYQITAKAYTTTGATGTSMGLQSLNVLKLRVADNPSGTVAGLKYNHYLGSFSTVDLLDYASVAQSGTRTNFDLLPRLQDDDFAFTFTGYVNVPTDGVYTFYTASDDGSVLWIGSSMVVANDGYHGTEEKSGRIGLKAGKHPIKVSYFEGGGDNVLTVSYEGPSIAKQTIPSSALSYVNNPVAVNLTSPAPGAIVVRPSNVALTASATTGAGNSINKIEYYAGTTLIATSTTSPFSAIWTSPVSGSYSITAKAFDNGGNSQVSAAASIVVDAAPTISISSPANNANVTSPVTLQVTAADADGTISQVEYFQGTTSIGVVTSSPFSRVWSPAASGTYTVTAKATDNYAVSTTSSAITLNVTVTNQPPTVSLTAPDNNATFTAPATVLLTATASDPGGSIAKVEFFNGTTLLQSVTSSPYQYSWTNVAAGTYTLTAKATDNGNLSATSTAAVITVSPPSTADIIGPDCGTSGALLSFNVNTSKRTNAVSYNWYYTAAGTVSSSPSTPYQVTLTGSTPFQAGQICVGVNYSVSPWYQSYCKSITVCPVPGMRDNSTVDNSEVTIGQDKVLLYPNPVQNLLHMNVESAESSTLVVALSDVLSKQLLEKTYLLAKGKNQYDLDLSELKEGHYTLTLSKGNDFLVKRIAVKK